MEEIKHKITFTKRPIPIFPSYRPMYRICQNLLVLKINCNGNKASLLKLHLFSWALKSDNNLRQLEEYFFSDFKNKLTYIGIEPSLNRALDYAIGENLIGFDKSKYYLKEKGEDFVQLILQDKELFASEKDILRTIGKSINETQIIQLQKSWSNA